MCRFSYCLMVSKGWICFMSLMLLVILSLGFSLLLFNPGPYHRKWSFITFKALCIVHSTIRKIMCVLSCLSYCLLEVNSSSLLLNVHRTSTTNNWYSSSQQQHIEPFEKCQERVMMMGYAALRNLQRLEMSQTMCFYCSTSSWASCICISGFEIIPQWWSFARSNQHPKQSVYLVQCAASMKV